MKSAEWIAVQTGIKPAMRLSGPTSVIESMIERASAAELHVVRATSTMSSGPHEQVVIYVAQDPERAEQLRDAEAPVFPGVQITSLDAAVEAHTRVGELLGYPACCIAAFCARLRRGVTTCADGSRAHEEFVAAEDAASRSDAYHGRLNPHLRREHLGLISFYPCRYDCRVALELAERIREQLARVDPAHASEMVSALDRPLVLGRDGVLGDGSGSITLPFDRP